MKRRCLAELAAPGGLVGGPFGSDLVSSDYTESGIPVIRGANMNYGRELGGDYVYVSEAKFERQLSRNSAIRGDLVFTQRGTLGQVAIVPEGVFVVSQSQMRLRPDTAQANPLFLYYACMHSEFLGQVDLHAIRTGVPHINLGILGQMEVTLPDLATQTAIADVLGALDDKIAANERLAGKSMELARASFERSVRDLPPVAISDLSTAVLGGTPDRNAPHYWGGSVPWVSVADVTKASHGLMIGTEESISVEATQRTRARVVPAGSTIVTARGTVGKLARTAFDGAFNQSCYAFVPGPVSSLMLFFALASGMRQAQAHSHGTVFQTITMRTFDHLTVPDVRLAPISLEDALALMAGRAESALRENRVLASARDALLPDLMSGRLAVKSI